MGVNRIPRDGPPQLSSAEQRGIRESKMSDNRHKGQEPEDIERARERKGANTCVGGRSAVTSHAVGQAQEWRFDPK